MNPFCKVVVSLLALLLLAAPIMACALPAAAMTAAEHDCCKRMAGECGKGGMSESHSCCKTVTAPDRLPVIKSSSDPSPRHTNLVLIHTLPQMAVITRATEGALPAWATNMHGPLGSPPVSVSILRI